MKRPPPNTHRGGTLNPKTNQAPAHRVCATTFAQQQVDQCWGITSTSTFRHFGFRNDQSTASRFQSSLRHDSPDGHRPPRAAGMTLTTWTRLMEIQHRVWHPGPARDNRHPQQSQNRGGCSPIPRFPFGTPIPSSSPDTAPSRILSSFARRSTSTLTSSPPSAV